MANLIISNNSKIHKAGHKMTIWDYLDQTHFLPIRLVLTSIYCIVNQNYAFELFIFPACLYWPHLCLATPAGLIDSLPAAAALACCY